MTLELSRRAEPNCIPADEKLRHAAVGLRQSERRFRRHPRELRGQRPVHGAVRDEHNGPRRVVRLDALQRVTRTRADGTEALSPRRGGVKQVFSAFSVFLRPAGMDHIKREAVPFAHVDLRQTGQNLCLCLHVRRGLLTACKRACIDGRSGQQIYVARRLRRLPLTLRRERKVQLAQADALPVRKSRLAVANQVERAHFVSLT